MAYADKTDGSRIILSGSGMVKVVLSEAVKVGDLVGLSAGLWKLADANNSIYAEYVAGEGGVSGDTITAYDSAVVRHNDTGGAKGDLLYLSDTAGGSSASAGTVNQLVGQIIAVVSGSHTDILLAPVFNVGIGGQLVPGDAKMFFRDSGLFIHSPADGKLTISADGGGLDDITLSGSIVHPDDKALGLGTGSPGLVLWDTTDANANALMLQLPTGGAVDVPVVVIGQGIKGVDLGLYNGVTEPRIAVFGVGAVTTAPIFEFRKARGTVAAPTVITTGDDLGSIDAYGYSGAGGYVLAARILFDSEGTVATTRVPGVIRFFVTTDAAPSVLTERFKINIGGPTVLNDIALRWLDSSSVAHNILVLDASNNIVIGVDGLAAEVFLERLAQATSGATMQDSRNFHLMGSYWTGAAAQNRTVKMLNNITAAGGSPANQWELWLGNQGSEVLRLTVDSAGLLTTVGAVKVTGGTLTVQDTSAALEKASADAVAIYLEGKKARGTLASPTIITTGDDLFTISAKGYDGTQYLEAARILFDTQGTIAANRVPGVIRFYTNTDAAPSVLTERMTIDSAGLITLPTATALASGLSLGSGVVLYTKAAGNGLAVQDNGVEWFAYTAGALTLKSNVTNKNLAILQANSLVLGLGAADGQANSRKIVTELLTIAAAATTDSAIDIPLNCVVYSVSVYTETVIPTAATYTVTGATTGTVFNRSAVGVAAGSSDVGNALCPYNNGAAQKVRITPNLTPATATGKVRITISYEDVTVATS